MSDINNTIHTILQENLKDYITAGDITYAADMLCKAVNSETGEYELEDILKAQSYIENDDCYFYQYKNEQSIVKNIIKLAFASIITALNENITAIEDTGKE